MFEAKESSCKEQKTFEGKAFPLVLEPKDNTEGENSIEKCVEWVSQNREQLRQQLLDYGAILFRNFPTKTPEAFNSFVESFGFENFPYVGGAAPRKHIVGNVFSSNESPPQNLIPFHHEMAQVPNYPAKLFFYCDHPSTQGGETPILLSNQVYQKVSEKHPEYVKDLREKGVHYVRVLPEEDDPESPIGRGWKSTFNAKTKEEAEEKCKNLNSTFEWTSEGNMKTITCKLAAIKTYQAKNIETWFNSIVAAYTGWEDKRNIPEQAVTFADGSPLPRQAVLDTQSIMQDVSVSIKWEQGDVILVDNHQTMHARNSFVPPRRIYAYLCK